MKKSILLLFIFSLFNSVQAVDYRRLECQYNDSTELERAIFTLNANMNVINEDTAYLTYKALIHYPDGSDYGSYWSHKVADNVVFAMGTNLKNAKYKGTKYTNHFKFELEWASVGGPFEYGDLIISKKPITTSTDKYGAKIEVFNGALDVSYNDHHGDTVWIKCTRRYF